MIIIKGAWKRQAATATNDNFAEACDNEQRPQVCAAVAVAALATQAAKYGVPADNDTAPRPTL